MTRFMLKYHHMRKRLASLSYLRQSLPQQLRAQVVLLAQPKTQQLYLTLKTVLLIPSPVTPLLWFCLATHLP